MLHSPPEVVTETKMKNEAYWWHMVEWLALLANNHEKNSLAMLQGTKTQAYQACRGQNVLLQSVGALSSISISIQYHNGALHHAF